MAAESYRVLFDGEISDGKDPDQVKRRLSRLFRRSAADIESLFSGKPRVLKTVERLEDGQRLLAAIARTGAVAKLESQPRDSTSKKEKKEHLDTIAPPAGFRYRMNITGAALVVGILWLVHLLVLTSLFAALAYHLVFNLDFYGTFGLAGLLFHALPALIGAAFLALLIKPLLPAGRTVSAIALKPGQAPLLDELLSEVCKKTDAPVPAHIALDSGAGIALDFGALPEIPTRRPTLQLGLTLIGGLTIRQFAGVLGRELGYLGRSQAARRTQFVRASHQRLQHAVFGRDELDHLLARLKKHSGPGALSGHLGGKLLALARELHRGLLKIVTVVSAGPLELLQFRSDSIQARLSGSETFRGTLSMQHLLEMAFKAAAEQEKRNWIERGELTERLPIAALSLAREQAEQFQAEIRTVVRDGPAGVESCRPTDLKRIRRIEKSPQTALYFDERPARQLVSGFEFLNRRASYLYYRSTLLTPITSDRLIPVVSEPSGAERLLRSYFLDLHRAPVPLHQLLPEGTATVLREKLREAADRSKEEQVGNRVTLQYYFEIERQLIEANAREVLVNARVPLPEGKVDLENIHVECRKLESEEEKTARKLRELVQAPSQRLAIGLAYLGISAPERFQEEVGRLHAALRRTDEVLPKLRSLHMHSTILELLLSYGSSRNSALKDRIDERARDVSQLLMAIRLNLREAPWPFGVPVVGDNLAKHAINGDFDGADPYGLLDVAGMALSRTQAIRQRILARLAQLAVSAEKRLLGSY
ncbi:M48 family metalloprotease [Thiohalomonas denitrificans]|uniref:Uncharacterized protein n=1 Tax=Thiohalomonas denitrificans TaxID=415747 RepID=A0A1G5QUN8_9GAMM|nr:hypothetical protein [Thiohalomonas denitrificans]SCZ65563.1 hypothetical protein SAMN03097708_02840 [Thiohalomonas denitrificans]